MIRDTTNGWINGASLTKSEQTNVKRPFDLIASTIYFLYSNITLKYTVWLNCLKI